MSMTSRIARPPVADREPSGRTSAVLSRVIIGVMLLMLTIVSATVFLLALGLLSAPSVVSVFAPVDELLRSIATLAFMDRAIAGVAAAAVGVTALALMIRTPGELQQTGNKHILQADEKGVVVIGAESVETVAVQTALRSPGVLDARVSVKGRPSGPVSLRVHVDVLPGADVKRVGIRIQDAVRSGVEDLVGLTVRAANVEVRVLNPDDLAEVMR